MKSDGTIDVDMRGRVAVVLINRPEKRNALTMSMVTEFKRVTEALDSDDQVRAIVISGGGSTTFCAGGDLTSLLPAAIDARMDVLNPDPSQRFLSRVFTPVVAAVEGACVGGGFEILLGTDIRIAAHSSFFALPEVSLGLIAGSGSNVRLPRQVPWPIAMEVLLLGKQLSAVRAYEVGLVNELVAPGTALDRACEVGLALAANGPLAVRTAKEVAVRSGGVEQGYVLEHALNSRVLSSSDAQEGVNSFRAKRTPDFLGH